MKRLDPLTLIFLALAGAWAMAQFVLAFFVHVTERAKLTSAGWVVPPTKTYIRTYAWSEVVLTAVVVGIVVAVGFLLGRRRRGGDSALVCWLGVCRSPLSSPGSSGSPTCSASRCFCVWHAHPSIGDLRPTCNGLQR